MPAFLADHLDEARLVSAAIPAGNATCLSFWYHMLGSAIGELNVYVKVEPAFTLFYIRTSKILPRLRYS